MGFTIQLTKCGAANQPMAAPTAMEMRELIMRLRSSLRCSKKVIAPAGSSGGVVICVLDSDSGTDSGRMLVVMGRFLGARNCGAFGSGLPRFFGGPRNRFGYRGNDRVLRGTGFRIGLT